MISKYILLFTLCSIVGWVYESIYAVLKTGAWENRGFLYGPMCPIYGFGVCGIVLVAKAYLIYAHAGYTWWGILIIAFIGSMVLEYAVSWALEQLFHAYWWDYTDMPLNINGRTCVPAGILFAFGGVAAVEIISPWWDGVMAPVPLLVKDIAAYAIVIVMTMDATLTVASLTEVQERVAIVAEGFHARADELTSQLVDNADSVVSRISAEKDRLQEEALQRSFDSLSATARMALSRVQGFRLSAPSLPAPNTLDIPAFTKNLLDRAKNAVYHRK